jgi:DNA-binding protein H-NS
MEQKSTYTALKTQIDKLQKEADEILKTERISVIERIKEAVVVYGLTAKELGLGKQLRKPQRKKNRQAAGLGPPSKVLKKPKAAKFTDGKGNEWNGKGEQPEWVKAAVASGRALSEFRRKPVK